METQQEYVNEIYTAEQQLQKAREDNDKTIKALCDKYVTERIRIENEILQFKKQIAEVNLKFAEDTLSVMRKYDEENKKYKK